MKLGFRRGTLKLLIGHDGRSRRPARAALRCETHWQGFFLSRSTPGESYGPARAARRGLTGILEWRGIDRPGIVPTGS